MAYVAGQSQEDQDAANNVATNIFQTSTGQQGQGGMGAQGGAAGTPDQSTSIGAGGGSGAPQKAAPQSMSASSSKEVIRRNAGKEKSPYDLNQMGSDIATARQNIQDESNKYISDQGNNNYAVDDDTIKKGLYGDDAAFGQTGQRLTQAQPQYQLWAPTTNTDFQSTLNKVSDNGLRDYFKSANGPMTTSGESALDTMLLGQNRDFKQQRQAVNNQAATLGSQVKALQDTTDTNAKSAYDTGYSGETDREKGVIKGEGDSLLAGAQSQADAENALRKKIADEVAKNGNTALLPYMQQLTGKSYDQWMDDAIAQVAKTPQEAEYLRNNYQSNLKGAGPAPTDGFSFAPSYGTGVKPSDMVFANLMNGTAGVNNFLTGDQATALNRSNALLGAGGQSYAPASLDGAIQLNPDAALAYLNKTVNDYRGNAKATNEGEAKENKSFDDQVSMYNQVRAAAAGSAAAREGLRSLNRLDKLPTNVQKWVQNNFPDIDNDNTVFGQLMNGGDFPASMFDQIDQGGAVGGPGKVGGGLDSGDAGLPAGTGKGKILCTEYARLGWLPEEILAADTQYQQERVPFEVVRNYLAWASYVVPVIRRNPAVRAIFWPMVRTWAYSMAYKMGKTEKKPFGGHFLETVGVWVSNGLGSAIRERSKQRRIA